MTDNTSIVTCDIDTKSLNVMHHAIIERRDSGVHVCDLNVELDAKPRLEALDAKPAATCAEALIDATSLDSQLGPITRKRTASYKQDIDNPKTSKRVKSSRRERDDSVSSIRSNIDAGLRVGCPFYKKDPEAHSHVSSCRGKGFEEVAKIKDHLKDVHNLKGNLYTKMLDFRPKSFKSLTLEHKWIWIFQKLFPEVPYHDIPSAFVGDEPPADLRLLKDILNREIMEHYRIEMLCGLPILNFDANFDGIFEKAIQDWKNSSATQDTEIMKDAVVKDTIALNKSLHEPSSARASIYLTPPPSATNSPHMGQDNVKTLNALPTSPVSITEDLSLTTIEASWMQNLDMDDLFPAVEFVQHSKDAPPVTNRGTYTTDFVPNYTQSGTWVFVPSDSGPLVDMSPTPFIHNQYPPTWTSDSKTATDYTSMNSFASYDQPARNPNYQDMRLALSADTSQGLDMASIDGVDQYIGFNTQLDYGDTDLLHSSHASEDFLPDDNSTDFYDIIDWSELDA